MRMYVARPDFFLILKTLKNFIKIYLFLCVKFLCVKSTRFEPAKINIFLAYRTVGAVGLTLKKKKIMFFFSFVKIYILARQLGPIRTNLNPKFFKRQT